MGFYKELDIEFQYLTDKYEAFDTNDYEYAQSTLTHKDTYVEYKDEDSE